MYDRLKALLLEITQVKLTPSDAAVVDEIKAALVADDAPDEVSKKMWVDHAAAELERILVGSEFTE